jgi:hypothetical protein
VSAPDLPGFGGLRNLGHIHQTITRSHHVLGQCSPITFSSISASPPFEQPNIKNSV